MNKGKKANVKPFMVKNYLSVFINCMIENPAFDSQVLTYFLKCYRFTVKFWCTCPEMTLM